MNLPVFITRRITAKSEGSFSQSIYRVAVISIAVGLGALLISFMILRGYEQKILEKVYSFSGHLLITKYTMTASFEDSFIMIDDTLRHQLASADYVRDWQAFAFMAGLLKTSEEVQGVHFKGVDETFDTAFFASNMIKGRFPDLSQDGYSTDVAISSRIANYLRLDVGDKVMIYFVQNPPRFRNLTITGIYETGLEDFDQKIILGDLGLIQRLNDWTPDQVGGVEVFVRDGIDMVWAQETLFDTISIDLYVESARDKYLEIFDWLTLISRNVVIFLALILLVASFSMVSILLILIMERTQMIGMLKAMGSTTRLIRRVFMTLGFNLILRGMGWGNGVALLIGFLQYQFEIIPLDPANYYVRSVPIVFNWGTFIGLNVLTFALIGISLLIPVSIISRIQPIKAIRFD